MASHKFSELPTEIVSQICEALSDGQPADVQHFALASRSCHQAACPVLYKSLMFDPTSERLAEQVEHCKMMLKEHGAFRHVHRMVLTNKRPLHTFSHGWSWDPDCNIDYDLKSLRGLGDKLAYCNLVGSSTPLLGLQAGSEDCQPLADLVTLLPGLADMYFLWPHHPFPSPRLLQALEEKQKFCRLHHYTLEFPSLSEHEFGCNDVALAKSPNLYSVGVAYREAGGYDEMGRPSYIADAIGSMLEVDWLAPNLREVPQRRLRGKIHAAAAPYLEMPPYRRRRPRQLLGNFYKPS